MKLIYRKIYITALLPSLVTGSIVVVLIHDGKDLVADCEDPGSAPRGSLNTEPAHFGPLTVQVSSVEPVPTIYKYRRA